MPCKILRQSLISRCLPEFTSLYISFERAVGCPRHVSPQNQIKIVYNFNFNWLIHLFVCFLTYFISFLLTRNDCVLRKCNNSITIKNKYKNRLHFLYAEYKFSFLSFDFWIKYDLVLDGFYSCSNNYLTSIYCLLI